MFASDVTVMNPYVQLGFAGFAFVLMSAMTSLLVWAVRNLVRVSDASTKVIAANTATIDKAVASMDETKKLAIEIKDRQLENPCMLPDAIKDKIRPIIKQHYAESQYHADK